MLKCLHCEAEYDSNDLEFCFPAVYYHDPEYDPGSFASFVCSNGHLNGVKKRANEPYIVREKDWYQHMNQRIPGSLSYLCIFNFETNKWDKYKISLTEGQYNLFTEYLKQQNQLKSETSASRLEWLKCALRLNICKDVRLLIGRYIKPSEFWKIEESLWCVVQ
jgi:hypothetical protein